MIRFTFRRRWPWDSGGMETIEQYVRSMEGRVFTHDGHLHFVLDADRQTGLARLSCRYDRRTEIIYMPVAEVVLRLEEECRKHAANLDRAAQSDL